jgi:hypothetical protein
MKKKRLLFTLIIAATIVITIEPLYAVIMG